MLIKCKIKACQSEKTVLVIELSQRQFGIEVRKYEMLSGIYNKMGLLKVRRIDL